MAGDSGLRRFPPLETADDIVEIISLSTSPNPGPETREDDSNVGGRDACCEKYFDEDSTTKGDDVDAEDEDNIHSEHAVNKRDESEDDEEVDSQFSLYEEILEASLETDDSSPPPDAEVNANSCTQEESLAFRKRLREIGEEAFIEETVAADKITAKKLCTAFGIQLPFWLEGAPDAAYYRLLDACISRELSRRVKLRQYNTFEDAVDLLKRSRNIVVLTGAGISTSLGIPDFRSKETGLYARLEHLGLSDPQEVFDIGLFREDPSIFYSVAKDILPSTNKFSPTHAFIRLLQDQNKLLTNFTQNIDNLEQHAGIREDKLIQCHGSFATASCIECKHKVDGKVIFNDIKAGRIAQCQRCLGELKSQNFLGTTGGLKRKRSSDSSASGSKAKARKKSRKEWEDSSSEDEEHEVPVAGTMKPDITFFGEDLPANFHSRLVKHDRELVDLVIVIGTSLKVAPVSEVVGIIPSEVPQIYVSREPCSHVEFDIDLLGDCDTVVSELARRVGWQLTHEMIPNPMQEAAVEPVEGWQSRWKVSKPSSSASAQP